MYIKTKSSTDIMIIKYEIIFNKLINTKILTFSLHLS